MAVRNKAPIVFLFMSTSRIIGFGRFETRLAVFRGITDSYPIPDSGASRRVTPVIGNGLTVDRTSAPVILSITGNQAQCGSPGELVQLLIDLVIGLPRG
ncbi:hypothetical protein D3C81_1596530 [compost metagenome]